ncbi:hypothetical protein [Compostimonas suwonensis]|uniref:Surface cell wall-binding protein n=1 Tax=Compostimonas suwonensis TaxID=1048394 RepID=A0A2M9BWJ9_9MICO|nr:hypothetical protein [Compostimonas suwonensis]PJJ62332.1 hypothetical protein CLV54_2132 [Compostimonas suwonensis]
MRTLHVLPRSIARRSIAAGIASVVVLLSSLAAAAPARADTPIPGSGPGPADAQSAVDLWRRADPDALAESAESPDPLSPGFEIGLYATTIPAVDGPLSFESAVGETAELDEPERVNGLSVTRGVLPEVTVSDDRVVSRPGWDITADVTDFVNDADASIVIGTVQLGLRPLVISATDAGIDPAAEQHAGDAHYPAPFASAASGGGVGDTVLGGELTLVSPADKPAGTYRATMTLTIVSR